MGFTKPCTQLHPAPSSSTQLHSAPSTSTQLISTSTQLNPAPPSSFQPPTSWKYYNFFIFVYKFQFKWSECFFNFRSSTRKSRSQFCLRKRSRKLAKKATHFAVHFRSKNLTHFMDLNWLDIDDNMLPQHRQKPLQK